MKTSPSKIKVYTNGIVDEGVGAYSYIVLECKDWGEVEIAGVKASAFSPSLLKARFAQAGPATDETRMKMRAVYEGIRHCPDGVEVNIYSDNFLMRDILESTKPDEEDGDIAVRYRAYVENHGVKPVFWGTKYYNGKEFPPTEHDEWTWYAHYLCENAIKKYKKEHRNESTD